MRSVLLISLIIFLFGLFDAIAQQTKTPTQIEQDKKNQENELASKNMVLCKPLCEKHRGGKLLSDPEISQFSNCDCKTLFEGQMYIYQNSPKYKSYGG